mgnify:CR=1 FL=1
MCLFIKQMIIIKTIIFICDFKMRNKISTFALGLSLISSISFATSTSFAASTQATEFDQYLQSKKIIDDHFIIIEKQQFNELLASISAEDSRTLPLQIDQNTIIEKLALFADHTDLEGIITTPDFNQLENDLGKAEIKKLIEKNLINNCNILFEHKYQQSNPYHIDIVLNSDHNQYTLKIQHKDCGI